MFPKGTIYTSKSKRRHAEVRVSATILEKVIYSILRGTGAGIIAFFVLWIMFTIYPIAESEIEYLINNKTSANDASKTLETRDKSYTIEAETTQQVQQEALSLGINSYFSIYIPKIQAKSQIIANVDTAEENDYLQALKNGVAHAKGTYFPGQGKNIYLFAHSTDTDINVARYNAIFYLLRKLEKGDEIIIFFSDKKYIYYVDDKTITNPTDISWLNNNSQEETLILQTCYPPGTSLKRLIVTAKPLL
jgi:sortase A